MGLLINAGMKMDDCNSEDVIAYMSGIVWYALLESGGTIGH